MQSVQSAEVPYRSGSSHLMMPSLYYRHIICSCFRLHLWNPLSLSPYIFAQKPHLIRDIEANTLTCSSVALRFFVKPARQSLIPSKFSKSLSVFRDSEERWKISQDSMLTAMLKLSTVPWKALVRSRTLIPILAFCIWIVVSALVKALCQCYKVVSSSPV